MGPPPPEEEHDDFDAAGAGAGVEDCRRRLGSNALKTTAEEDQQQHLQEGISTASASRKEEQEKEESHHRHPRSSSNNNEDAMSLGATSSSSSFTTTPETPAYYPSATSPTTSAEKTTKTTMATDDDNHGNTGSSQRKEEKEGAGGEEKAEGELTGTAPDPHQPPQKVVIPESAGDEKRKDNNSSGDEGKDVVVASTRSVEQQKIDQDETTIPETATEANTANTSAAEKSAPPEIPTMAASSPVVSSSGRKKVSAPPPATIPASPRVSMVPTELANVAEENEFLMMDDICGDDDDDDDDRQQQQQSSSAAPDSTLSPPTRSFLPSSVGAVLRGGSSTFLNPPRFARPASADIDDDDDSDEQVDIEHHDDYDEGLQRQLNDLEGKVVMEDLLHHRRLPSTIYEDTPNSQQHRKVYNKTVGGDTGFEGSAADQSDSSGFDDSFFLSGSPEPMITGVAVSASANAVPPPPLFGQDNNAMSKEEKVDDRLLQLQQQEQEPIRLEPRLGQDGSNVQPRDGLAGQQRKSFSFDNLQKLIQRQFQSDDDDDNKNEQQQQKYHSFGSTSSLTSFQLQHEKKMKRDEPFAPIFASTRLYQAVSKVALKRHYSPVAAATWVGFFALLHVSCSNHVLTPLRDAIALQVGVEHMPTLTLVSTVLAFGSSVPIGWLFEAPDPGRRKLWKRMGLTRGETQGTSLALFYRFFALTLVSYAIGFQFVQFQQQHTDLVDNDDEVVSDSTFYTTFAWLISPKTFRWAWQRLSTTVYVAFFLVVHLMKLHSTSLVWGVTTEAMEYEEVARRKTSHMESNKTRLQRLALVGFGGTMGGLLGSVLASSMAYYVRLPGLLMLAAFMLEISAELSIELGRIMQKHWEEQQLFQSSNDLASLDSSMRRIASLGSMKRVASGNSLNRAKSAADLQLQQQQHQRAGGNGSNDSVSPKVNEPVNDDTFTQRLLRGVTTIIRSRLLMAIFTYNALYASTTVLLSFQRAELVANRKANTTAEADTAFLARINMASSVAIFALQASGMGAYVAHACGSRGTLMLMPLIRLLGVLSLAWWHHTSNGKPPNLMVFLVVDECCKVMNLAVAKPVRESLWRGLSNEARYEAKPIVDTLANRWGGGSAAFLVSFINRTLDLFGVPSEGDRKIFGLPPKLFLCMAIATWWAFASGDLGRIRRSIDLELKKCQ